MPVRPLTRYTAVLLTALLAGSAVEAVAARPRAPAERATTASREISARRVSSTAVAARAGQIDGAERRAKLGALRARWPVSGPINSDFGARRSPWRVRAHRGVDIGARPGTPVRAPLGGAVAFAGWRSGYGKTVVIDHGGEFHTLYGHLSSVGVRRGQRIDAGTPIGRTGATGNASGPHLHYELLVRGRAVNPRGAISPVPAPRGAASRATAPAP